MSETTQQQLGSHVVAPDGSVNHDSQAGERDENITLHHGHAKDYIELHSQVQTGLNLLDSLESFLSTFQKELSSVSGQISELQNRSRDIDHRLKSRRKIEKPLSKLVSELTIPPSLALIILDSEVGEPWIQAVRDFERRLVALSSRGRVKAARDLSDICEGLRIVVATKLRAFFLALLHPVKNSVTTNVQVLQSSVYLKYRSLFAFLQRQAETVAKEIQDSYIATARTYYETAFRRYIRSLGWLRSRVTEKFDTITAPPEQLGNSQVNLDRLAHGKIEGPSVILAYMADDKTHKESLEAILRSLLLVLMDNATAEYSFIISFFALEPLTPVEDSERTTWSVALSSDRSVVNDEKSIVGSESLTELANPVTSAGQNGFDQLASIDPATLNELNNLWKKIFDPVLEYTKNFLTSVIDPSPPTVSLFTMTQLTEAVVAEVQKRQCPPLEAFFFSIRLLLWPVFQTGMSEHYDSLARLVEKPSGYFAKTKMTTDVMVSDICENYITMFQSFVLLACDAEETMVFGNLLRLQQKLDEVIVRHTDPITDPVAKATKKSSIYEILLHGLIKGSHLTTHRKVQKELSYWTEKEKTARQVILSAGQRRKIRGQ